MIEINRRALSGNDLATKNELHREDGNSENYDESSSDSDAEFAVHPCLNGLLKSRSVNSFHKSDRMQFIASREKIFPVSKSTNISSYCSNQFMQWKTPEGFSAENMVEILDAYSCDTCQEMRKTMGLENGIDGLSNSCASMDSHGRSVMYNAGHFERNLWSAPELSGDNCQEDWLINGENSNTSITLCRSFSDYDDFRLSISSNIDDGILNASQNFALQNASYQETSSLRDANIVKCDSLEIYGRSPSPQWPFNASDMLFMDSKINAEDDDQNYIELASTWFDCNGHMAQKRPLMYKSPSDQDIPSITRNKQSKYGTHLSLSHAQPKNVNWLSKNPSIMRSHGNASVPNITDCFFCSKKLVASREYKIESRYASCSPSYCGIYDISQCKSKTKWHSMKQRLNEVNMRETAGNGRKIRIDSNEDSMILYSSDYDSLLPLNQTTIVVTQSCPSLQCVSAKASSQFQLNALETQNFHHFNSWSNLRKKKVDIISIASVLSEKFGPENYGTLRRSEYNLKTVQDRHSWNNETIDAESKKHVVRSISLAEFNELNIAESLGSKFSDVQIGFGDYHTENERKMASEMRDMNEDHVAKTKNNSTEKQSIANDELRNYSINFYHWHTASRDQQMSSLVGMHRNKEDDKVLFECVPSQIRLAQSWTPEIFTPVLANSVNCHTAQSIAMEKGDLYSRSAIIDNSPFDSNLYPETSSQTNRPLLEEEVTPISTTRHRRLPALPLNSTTINHLMMRSSAFSSNTRPGYMSSYQQSNSDDHRICFGTDSMIGRSSILLEDSYYEEDNLHSNKKFHTRGAVERSHLEDSSGVSSCCTGSEHLNPTHRVQSTFIPRHSDEIILEIGDAIHVERECEDHWCYGTNLRTTQNGIFPSAHVCEIDLVEEICMGALSAHTNRTMENERDIFYLTMLASIEVAHHKGNDVLIQAINKVVALYQNKDEVIVPQTVLMEISFRGIHLIDKRKKNFFQCPSFDFFYSLQNISFCGAHPKQLRYFGFITKHPLLPKFACHVFLSNGSTQPIVEAIGRAFKRSYDEYMAFAHPTEDIYLE